MKTILTFLVLLLCAKAIAADAPPQLRKWMVDPIRIVEGKEYDLRPFFQWHSNGGKGPNPMPEWELLFASVDQVTEKGLLVDYPRAFLKNYPRQNTLIDRSLINVVAKKSGPYQYVSVLGSTRTIRSYDYGTIPPEKRLLEIKAAEEKQQAEDAAEKAAAAEARAAAHKKAVSESKTKLEDLRKRNATP